MIYTGAVNCPNCGKGIASTFQACPHCKVDLTKPEYQSTIKAVEARPPSRSKLIWEIAKILIASSLLSAVAIGVARYSLSQEPVSVSAGSAKFRQLIGYTLAAMAAANLICAILLVKTKKSQVAWISVVLAAGLAIAWLIGIMVTLDSEELARKAVKLLFIPIGLGGLLIYKARRLQKAQD